MAGHNDRASSRDPYAAVDGCLPGEIEFFSAALAGAIERSREESIGSHTSDTKNWPDVLGLFKLR